MPESVSSLCLKYGDIHVTVQRTDIIKDVDSYTIMFLKFKN